MNIYFIEDWFLANPLYKIDKGMRAFAQRTIQNKIGEKKEWSKLIQDVDGHIIEPGYIEHVDYSEGSPCPQE